MLTGTPLDLTPFGPLLSALGGAYVVLALVMAGPALWLPKARIAKVGLTLAVLAAFIWDRELQRLLQRPPAASCTRLYYDGNLTEGGAGGDCLYGSSGADTIHGGEGNDEITGSAGQDILLGDEGDNRIDGDGVNVLGYISSVRGPDKVDDLSAGSGRTRSANDHSYLIGSIA